MKQTGAESIRWDLSDLYTSPTDPALEATLARALERARAFEAAYKGKVAMLAPHEFAEMMRELEQNEEEAAGRILARVREAAAERGAHGVFFSLELAQVTHEHAAGLYAHPESARYRHTIEEARKFRPHQLTEPEERVLTDYSPVGNSAW